MFTKCHSFEVDRVPVSDNADVRYNDMVLWKRDILSIVWYAVRVNEADAFADEDGANDKYFDFEDISGAHLLP